MTAKLKAYDSVVLVRPYTDEHGDVLPTGTRGVICHDHGEAFTVDILDADDETVDTLPIPADYLRRVARRERRTA